MPAITRRLLTLCMLLLAAGVAQAAETPLCTLDRDGAQPSFHCTAQVGYSLTLSNGRIDAAGAQIGGSLRRIDGGALCAGVDRDSQRVTVCGDSLAGYSIAASWDEIFTLSLLGLPADASGTGGTSPLTGKNFTVLAANDLGMHCADQDYRIFSILPPYNVVHAQVLEKGARPRILSPEDGVEVVYSAVSSNIENAAQPGTLLTSNSITSTSQNDGTVFKGNFWDGLGGAAFGFNSYEPLYPAGVLGAFPFDPDLGLPAPDLEALYLGPDGIIGSGDEQLTAEQSSMPSVVARDPTVSAPYIANEPQAFHGFVKEFPFFIGDHNGDGAADFPFGYLVPEFNRFTAEGIPILPVDDQGRENAYPLMRVQARDQLNNQVLASTDVVVPVASEADCQQCHASQTVCNHDSTHTLICDDIANTDSGVAFLEDASQAPGETPEQRVVNTAKINILRLHDARHGTALDAKREVVCASCHYSPALDLAQLGPNDDNGKQQTQHVSMSRAMHYAHGKLPESGNPLFADLFPDMPPPGHADRALKQEILQQTCYSCHPGKRTKCLRGAMGGGGIVCQDCHGQMTQVGNDFSANLPQMDVAKRVPWASEPKCQSCHVGDILQRNQLEAQGQLGDVMLNPVDADGNPDGLRLNMAYRQSDHSYSNGPEKLPLLDFAGSRFASDQPLYRLSGSAAQGHQGHGGLACNGCHGSPHAIWPNRNPLSNDNAAAKDIQGHGGTVIECTACHEGSLGITLNGPHGMHPVNDANWVDRHENIAESNLNACRTCHGTLGDGSVLSRAAADRVLSAEGRTVRFTKGQPVGCYHCHENELNGGGGDD